MIVVVMTMMVPRSFRLLTAVAFFRQHDMTMMKIVGRYAWVCGDRSIYSAAGDAE